MRLLRLRDESIDRAKELFPIGKGSVEHKLLRMPREQLVMRHPCPASDVAVAKQSQAAHIFRAPRMPEVGEYVFQRQPQSLIPIHGKRDPEPGQCFKLRACSWSRGQRLSSAS